MMTMGRKELLDTLGIVRPALATTNLIQFMTHLRFSARDVTAYNDQIGISTPMPAGGLAGVVPGATLLSMLAASGAKEVELSASPDEPNILLKLAGAKLKLPLLAGEAFLFEMPAAKGASLPVDKALVDAIRGCLRSTSQDTSVPDQLGITLIPKKKSIDLYSVNGASLSRATVPVAEQVLKERVVLSAPFCEQMVRLAAGDKKPTLVLASDHALFKTAAGTRLFGKYVDVPKPLDFEGQLAEVLPDDLDQASVPVPKALGLALDRALIMSDPSGERVYSQLAVKSEAMILTTKSAKGEIVDRVRVPKHPDVAVSTDAQWLKVGCEAFDHVLVTEGAVIFGRGRSVYLVSTTAA